MSKTRLSRPRFPYLAFLAIAIFAFLGVAHAEEAPPPAQTPPAQTPPAQTPPPPAEAPQRREEEANPPATAAAASSLSTRVSAALSAMRGQGAAVTQLADRDATILQLRSDLAARDRDLTALRGEVTSLRAERTEIENAMRGLESERADVTTTVSRLGFPAQQLPGPASLDQVEDGSPAGCYNKWQELKKTDPKAARAYATLHDKTIRAYARTQPQFRD